MSKFGKPRDITGEGGTFSSTLVPMSLLGELSRIRPYPITIGGTSNRTFTLNASKTAPFQLWTGQDYIELKEAKSYSWVVGSNTVLNTSTGVEETLTNSTTGVWYMYLGYDGSGALELYPSKVAPSYVEGPNQGGIYSHPGTARAHVWNYVGFMLCDATTPTFIAMERGENSKTWEFLAQSVATTTTWAVLDFSLICPGHGVEVGGFLETSSTDNDTTEVGTSATNLTGEFKVKNAAAADQQVPFFGIVPNASGQFYGSSTTAAGDVHITRIKDIV